MIHSKFKALMFLHNFAFDDPEAVSFKQTKKFVDTVGKKIEVRYYCLVAPWLGWSLVFKIKKCYLIKVPLNWNYVWDQMQILRTKKMQSCYCGQGARVVNTRRNGILINFPVRRGECLVSDTRQAVGTQGGLYRDTLVFDKNSFIFFRLIFPL